MRIILFIIFLLTSGLSFSQNTPVVKDTIEYSELFDSAKTRNGFYVVQCPPLRKFINNKWTNGNPSSFLIGKFKNGEQDSIWNWYRNWGKTDSIVCVQYFVNGIIGKQFNYYENGQKSYELTFNNGRLISKYNFNENGVKKSESHCINPKKDNLFGNAKVVTIKFHDNGNTFEIEYTKQKAVRYKSDNYDVLSVKRIGCCLSFYENGQLYERINYLFGLVIKRKKYDLR